MDVDVEMVESNGPRDKNEVVAAERFGQDNNDIVDHPSVRRQNICFLIAMFSCIVGFTVYVVGRVYMVAPGDGLLDAMESHSSGEIDNHDTKTKVSIAQGKYSNWHGKGWSKNHPNNHGNPIPSKHDEEVRNWINTPVTLQDGVKYEVVAQLYHDKTSFTEGLCFVEGRLFESTGMKQASVLQELDPDTGHTIRKWQMKPKDFGEGLTYLDGYLVQLTYKQMKGYMYDIHNLDAAPSEFGFHSTTGEGWGLTYSAEMDSFIASDGSNELLFWDPKTVQLTKRLPVFRMSGEAATNINELEMWRGFLLANVWYEDCILVINLQTGTVIKEYDFSQLWPQEERHQQGANVLNGISVSADEDVIYVTGKYWDRMFKIRLLV